MLEQHVPSLETCKRMKELGWKQKNGTYYWVVPEECGNCDSTLHLTNNAYLCECNPFLAYCDYMSGDYQGEYHAPLLSEIMEEIRINEVEFFFDITEHGEYEFEHYDSARSIADYQQYHKNPAEAAALLWIRLREEGIIK